jgi:hypothetical protein
MTRDEVIIRDIKAGFATITVANGYLNTILSTQVKHWCAAALKKGETQIFNIIDQPEHVFDGGGYTETIRLVIQIVVSASSAHSKLSRLTQDIEKYFHTSKSTFLAKFPSWFIKPVTADGKLDITDYKRGTKELAFEIIHRIETNYKNGPDLTVYT